LTALVARARLAQTQSAFTKAHSGRADGIILTNIGTSSLNVTIPVDFIRLGLTPGRRYSVNLTDETGTRFATSISVSRSLTVQIAPLQIVLVSLQ
jgi:hypothetical protein